MRATGRRATWAVVILAATVGLLASGCASQDSSGTGTADARVTAELKPLFLTDTLPGFVPLPNGDRALNQDAAAQATSADVSRMRTQLTQTTFEGGYERIFTRDPDQYLTIIALEFQLAEDATAMVHFQVNELRNSGGTAVAADPVLSGAYAYDLEGTTRGGGKTVYCGGEWFSLDRIAFDINFCGYDAYTSANYARLLARNQYQQAGVALALISPAPTPTPPQTYIAPPTSSP